mgnify:CR=1 FL=1
MQYMYSPTAEAIAKNEGEIRDYDFVGADARTNIDELRSVEINFPQDAYYDLREAEPVFKSGNKIPEPAHSARDDEGVIEL